MGLSKEDKDALKFLTIDKDYLIICDFCGNVDEWNVNVKFIYCKEHNIAICENCVSICNEILKEWQIKLDENKEP